MRSRVDHLPGHMAAHRAWRRVWCGGFGWWHRATRWLGAASALARLPPESCDARRAWAERFRADGHPRGWLDLSWMPEAHRRHVERLSAGWYRQWCRDPERWGQQ